MVAGKITVAAIASTVSALVAILGTNWFNAAKLNVDQANLAMRYVEFAQGPAGGAPPSLQDKIFVMRAMASAGFGQLAMQARDEVLNAQSQITEEQLNQPVHPSLNLGISNLTVGQLESMLSVVNLFERGTPAPDYTVSAHARGELALGGFSLSSGRLSELIAEYVESPQARYASEFAPYLSALQQKDAELAANESFLTLLRRSAEDPTMQNIITQLHVRLYFGESTQEARSRGLREPLSYLVMYDSNIHGGWAPLARQVEATNGPLSASNEREWMRAYLQARRDWLRNHANPLLPRTAYRSEALLSLIEASNWQLTPPFAFQTPRGRVVVESDALRSSALVRANTDAVLADTPVLAGDGPGFFERTGATIDAMFGGGG